MRYLVVLLAGCATYDLPLEQRYTRLDWARTSVHQADAECRAHIQANPMVGFNICMQSRGWQAR